MSGFYIKSITAHGNGKRDASISFCKGLNIIQGYSDTGKTCIVKCIDFIFGSSEKPFDKSTGYSRVTMQLVTPSGNLVLGRTIGRNQIQVDSEVQDIESGTYDIGYKKKQKNPVINSVWLKLLGIDGEPMIVKNSDFDKKHLTWRTLLSLIYIDEDSIGKSESIIVPEQYTEKTLFLSALLYLISGRDFAETDAQTKKEIRVARRKAVEEYVNKQISGIADRKKLLSKQLSIFADVDVEAEIGRIITDIKATDAAITKAVNDSKELLSQIMAVEEKAAECDVLLSRYKALKSQYAGDIRRLTFIVEGEIEYQHVPHSTKCPFCDGNMPIHDRKSYIEASRAELSRIMAQLNGLGEAESDVQKEQIDIENELVELRSKRKDIEVLINEQLRPQADALQDALENYRAYIRLKHEMDVIQSFSDSWTTDLRELPDETVETLQYHPKEYFDDVFLAALDHYAKSILEECSYENLTSARFNLADFDIEVNGGKKSTTHGKGYRAFLNTIVALMFRRYLANDAKYNPGVLIIDTPLLGLDQGVDDAAPESMRTALFKFFMNNQSEGQLIVVENLDHIPNLDFEKAGATVTTFTKGRFEGRYGFLEGVY
jgi:hypothetical protein